MDEFYEEAMNVAKTYDVSTKPDTLVLYSISFLSSKENKIEAFDYVEKHPGAMMLDHTPCGIRMMDMGLENGRCHLKENEIAYLWKVASRRLLEGAAGNITAFVKEADDRSVFRSMELPTILANSNIKTINGIDKAEFAKTAFA